MEIPTIESMKSEDQAREVAVAWQYWLGSQSLSWGAFAEWQAFFRKVAEKFPNLKDEFQENGIA